MHDVIKVEKTKYDELIMIMEDYKVLKEDIEKLYNTLISLESIRKHVLDEEIEEI